MHPTSRLLVLPLLAALTCSAQTPPEKPALDWDRARALHQRAQRGETLSAADKAYLDQARAARAADRPAGKGNPARPDGRAGGRAEGKTTVGLKPLTEMGATDTHKGQDGGLYGKGLNMPPAPLADAARAAGRAVVPLDPDGKPAPHGKAGLISIGMSNTTREFSEFVQRARSDADLSPALVVIDGAQGGMAGRDWADPDTRFRKDRGGPWETLDQRIRAAGLTSNQVQAAWIKQAERNPGQLGDFPAHADVLAASITSIVQDLEKRYPNLRLVYLSSRLYAGFANSSLNPEPYAYEGAFAVRQVILKQDGTRPVILWGPYLWADGQAGRKSDGLVYRREDFASDGTHPSPSGAAKVAEQLMTFFKGDPSSRPWFVKQGP